MKLIITFLSALLSFVVWGQQSDFVRLKDLSSDFVYELKYATPDNFLKQAVYDCGECYLHKSTAEA